MTAFAADAYRDRLTLARRHKEATGIGPDDTLPFAEESGLTDEMSLYVPGEVCILLR